MHTMVVGAVRNSVCSHSEMNADPSPSQAELLSCTAVRVCCTCSSLRNAKRWVTKSRTARYIWMEL